MGFRILHLNPADREFLVQTLGNILNEYCPNAVAFGLLIAHRQLVTLVRRKNLALDAPDFNTIVNLIECHKANLVQGDHQLPFCLPKFDPNQFLYAYISYLWEGTGPCLVLLSVTNSVSEQLSKVRPRLEELFCTYKRYERLRATLLNPEGFTLREASSNNRVSTFAHPTFAHPTKNDICTPTIAHPIFAHPSFAHRHLRMRLLRMRIKTTFAHRQLRIKLKNDKIN